MWISAAFSYGMRSANSYFEPAGSVDWGLQFNPVAAIKADTAASRARERTLTRDEFRLLWRWLADVAPGNRAASAMQLMMVTGQRPGEILRLNESNYDKLEGMLEWSTTKNGRAHSIPLPRQARAILDGLKPNEHGLYCPRVYNTAEPMRAYTCDRLIANFIEETGTPHFINRDLRRTFKTLAGAAGLSKEIRDRLQNHARSDVSSKHYDKWDYVPEKRAAMSTWEAFVDILVADPD
jgi:integrase